MSKYAGVFAPGERLVYCGPLPIAGAVTVVTWDPIKWQEAGYVGSYGFRNGLVPVYSEKFPRTAFWWASPGQLSRTTQETKMNENEISDGAPSAQVISAADVARTCDQRHALRPNLLTEYAPRFAYALACPVPGCGCDDVHHSAGNAEIVISDTYDASPLVRGSVRSLPMYCEWGHEFVVCFGFHKGAMLVWCAVPPPGTTINAENGDKPNAGESR